MEFTLRQGDVTAKLFNVAYEPAQGFEEGGTWGVAEEYISAESDTKLSDGPATIQHGGTEFPTTVSVFEKEDEETQVDEPACTIDISYAAGLSDLAQALGLIEEIPKRPR